MITNKTLCFKGFLGRFLWGFLHVFHRLSGNSEPLIHKIQCGFSSVDHKSVSKTGKFLQFSMQKSAKFFYKNPPSTPSVCPVTKEAPSETRKETAAATSSGRPSLLRGVSSASAAFVSSE